MMRVFGHRRQTRTRQVASASGLIADDPPYLTFHLWMLVASASLFALFVAVESGGFGFVVENDTTYISDVILLFFSVSSVYCGSRALRLSRELMEVQRAASPQPASSPPNPATGQESWSRQFLGQAQTAGEHERDRLAEALEERVRGPHEIGWFITETLTKLGLLGTVIGFLIMLTALIGANQLEVSAMQVILRNMAAGMGIKIIATVVGLLCNIVLALQWVLLDRCADKIMTGARALAARGR